MFLLVVGAENKNFFIAFCIIDVKNESAKYYFKTKPK